MCDSGIELLVKEEIRANARNDRPRGVSAGKPRRGVGLRRIGQYSELMAAPEPIGRRSYREA